MFWNGASARDEISLHKWSGGTAQFHTLAQGLKHMWPVREICVACNAFWNLQIINVQFV